MLTAFSVLKILDMLVQLVEVFSLSLQLVLQLSQSAIVSALTNQTIFRLSSTYVSISRSRMNLFSLAASLLLNASLNAILDPKRTAQDHRIYP